jgi:DNA-binding transcriptional LysR family regulator
MNLSLRQLRVFVTVAQTGSFVEAARLLHVTSAALSVTVKALEDEVGFRVFERTTRSMRLTEEGERLLPVAQHLLAEHRNTLLAIDNIKTKKAGVVRVAASQLLSCSILPPAVSRFQAQWPDIGVVHVPALYDHVQEMAQRKEVDIAIGPERVCEPDVSARELFTSRLHLVCSVRHPFAALKAVRWSQLQQQKVLLADARAAPLLARDSGYKVDFGNAQEVGHFSTALAIAAENNGVMFAPAFTRPLLKPYELTMVPMGTPAAWRKFVLFSNDTAPLTRAATVLAEHLAREFGAAAGPPG